MKKCSQIIFSKHDIFKKTDIEIMFFNMHKQKYKMICT